jgi:hypothetical protein
VCKAAQYLVSTGWDANIRLVNGSIFLEAKRGDEAFVADIDNGDALLINGYDDLEYIDGLAFRKQWEKEHLQ